MINLFLASIISCFATTEATLIDVRTTDEYVSGHANGALHLNIHESGFDEKVRSLDPNKPYLVYCAVGGRAGKAIEKMKKLGFKDLTNIKTLENAKAHSGKICKGEAVSC